MTPKLHLPWLAALCFTACRIPPVQIETPEPVKVDINLRLDVYQHGGGNTGTRTPNAHPDSDTLDIEARRRIRMGDIQMFKNSRIVGENRNGLLEILNPPPGEYGDYVEKIVTAENTDRADMMRTIALDRAIPLSGLEKEQAALWRDRSFSGEWIEVPSETGAWRWIQKGADPAPAR